MTQKGSFLADEMGLGKTISAIALLVTVLSTKILEAEESRNDVGTYSVLVVCPATVIQ